MTLDWAWILLGYLLGSLPTAYLVAKGLKGVDIRTVGSGNVGATNVFRTVGKGAGVATLAVDVLKGFLPVWLALRQAPGGLTAVLCGLAAVAGHTWSPFLRFHGGKGVATSAGVFLALLPWPTLGAVAVFVAGFRISGHVSVGSMAGAVALAAGAFYAEGVSPSSVLSLVLSLLILFRHIPNLRRLFKGEELSMGKKG